MRSLSPLQRRLVHHAIAGGWALALLLAAGCPNRSAKAPVSPSSPSATSKSSPVTSKEILSDRAEDLGARLEAIQLYVSAASDVPDVFRNRVKEERTQLDLLASQIGNADKALEVGDRLSRSALQIQDLEATTHVLQRLESMIEQLEAPANTGTSARAEVSALGEGLTQLRRRLLRSRRAQAKDLKALEGQLRDLHKDLRGFAAGTASLKARVAAAEAKLSQVEQAASRLHTKE